MPHGGRRSCEAGWWFPGGEDHVQTPQDSDLNPGMWTRGHRSVPRIPENTANDERRVRGVCLCVPRWYKTSVLSPPDCNLELLGTVCSPVADGEGGFVPPMRHLCMQLRHGQTHRLVP